jgi:hypothetical protein
MPRKIERKNMRVCRRILLAITFWCSLFTIAQAEGNCESARVDYVGECGTSVDCLNNTFHSIEKQLDEQFRRMDARSRAVALLNKSHNLEEDYRKTFCGGIVRAATEFWNMFENKPLETPRLLSPDEKHQLSFIAASCNVNLLGEFLYQLKRQYCTNE